METYPIVFIFGFIVNLAKASPHHPRSLEARHEQLTLVLLESPCWGKAYGIDKATHRLVLTSNLNSHHYNESKAAYEDQINSNDKSVYKYIFAKPFVVRKFTVSYRCVSAICLIQAFY